MSKETYLKVGGYTPETEDTEAVIDRDYYRQGWIFKDEEAFLHYPDKVCYVPELSDEGYTRQVFWIWWAGRRNLPASASMRWTGSTRKHGSTSNTATMNGKSARAATKFMPWPGNPAPVRYADGSPAS